MKSFPFSYLIVISIFSPTILLAQNAVTTDTINSSYKGLPTLKQYAYSSSSMISKDSSWFKVGEKYVDEKTYRKYTQFADNINKCKPCILLSFDSSENLLYKSISYGDCRVGYWIEYYLNGKAKVIGHYKENTSGNWENIFYRGYCREDGIWSYYNKNGKLAYKEIWKDGILKEKINF